MPQASLLGPVLFNLFVNHLAMGVNSSAWESGQMSQEWDKLKLEAAEFKKKMEVVKDRSGDSASIRREDSIVNGRPGRWGIGGGGLWVTMIRKNPLKSCSSDLRGPSEQSGMWVRKLFEENIKQK